MKKTIIQFKNIRFANKSAPLALLGAMVLAFGLLIPWLGFYQDDWNPVFYAYARGIDSLWELLSYDARPFAVWVYAGGFSLLGFNPIAWQIASLFLRWLTVTVIWAIFEHIWPDRTRQNFTAALLFAIYPFFVIQPLAVTYTLHWTGYLVYTLSIWLMLLAAKDQRRYFLFTTLALIFETTYLFTLEYYAGIELLRPILLWFLLGDESKRKKVIQILRQWLPYLLVFLAYVIWRGFIYQSPVLAEGLSRGVPRGLNALLATPLQTTLSMLLNIIPDLVLLLVSAWYEILTPDSFNFKFATNILALGAALVGGALTYFYLSRSKNSNVDPDLRWKQQALFLGTTAVLFGLLPAYVGGHNLHTKLFPWNARLALGSLFGAGLLATLVLEIIISSAQPRQIVLALLVGLTIGWHTRNTNIFRHAWEAQTDFYHQLILRAPSITPHTAFIVQDEFLGMMGDYPTSFALNTIYAEPLSVPNYEARTWLFVIDSNFGGRVDGLLGGMPLLDKKHSTEFIGRSNDSLVIRYEPDLGECLWLIKPEDAAVQIVPETLRVISPLSNTQLIDTSATPSPFLQAILPTRPDNWCAYYQRGSLALQLEEWDKVILQWEEAGEKGLRPANGFEYLPFIESYGMARNWPQAFELTRTSNKVSKSMENALCSVWTRLQEQTVSSPERENAVAKVKDYLGCR